MIGKSKCFGGLICLCIGLLSCTEQFEKEQHKTENLTVNVQLATLSTEAAENELDDVSVYLFSDGRLKGTQNEVRLNHGEPCRIPLTYSEGDHLYFVSQTGKVMTSVPESEAEFCKVQGRAYEEESVPVFVTGGISLSKTKPNTVKLVRGVARIDLNIAGENISVKRVELHDMATQGYLFGQEGGTIPEVASRGTLVADHADQPLTGLSTGVFYVYEQQAEKMQKSKVHLTYQMDGQEHTVEAELPQTLQRNKIYTLNLIRKQNVDLSVAVTPWGKGEETDLSPDLTQRILINKELSHLPTGARISEKGDTLFLPETGGTATLAFRSIGQVVCESASAADVQVVQTGENGKNMFTVTGVSRVTGQPTAYIDLLMSREGMITTVNRVTVVLPATSIQLYKDKSLTQSEMFVDGVLDYGKYVDGTLGYLVVPEGSKVEVTNGIWIRLDEQSEVTMAGKDIYRVEGGFKPNDLEADGRVQEASVSVGDGNTFVFKRRNWGLPVVEINGVYWCKYNLRGNAKKFEDQVSIRCDRDTVQSLEGFLRTYMINHPVYEEDYNMEVKIPKSVSAMELFYKLLGEGYQSGKLQGMRFKSNKILSAWGDSIMSDKYYYPGYDTYYWEQETGLLPADSLAPDGYKIPENSDFMKLVPNENFMLGTQGNTKSYAVGSTTMNVEIFYMPTMSFEMRQFAMLGDRPQFQGNFNVGGAYGTSFYYFFKEEGKEEPLVLMGHPYQYRKTDGGSATVFYLRDILFACHDSKGKAWLLNGYGKGVDTNPAYFKSMTGNVMNNVKMIRCVKKPVNYIIK